MTSPARGVSLAHHVTPPRASAREGALHRLGAPADATWEVIDRVREASRLPVVVKGVLTADDARRAVDHGAQAVIVSNHGGRQLDGARASLEALPEVVRAVGERAEVYLDGGVRNRTFAASLRAANCLSCRCPLSSGGNRAKSWRRGR